MTISCQSLWGRPSGGWPDTLLRGSLRPNGRLIVTDRGVALYADQLTGCTDMPAPDQLTPLQVRRLTHMLVMPWLNEYVTPVFATAYLDPLEQANYYVRPLGARTTRRKLVGFAMAHGIVDPDGRIAGVIMPWHDPGRNDPVRPVSQ
jgi:hypothetical protein